MATSPQDAHFGTCLKRARQVRGLTQTALANASGTSLPTIHVYEGKSVFGRGRLHLLAAIVQALHRARPLSPAEEFVLTQPLAAGGHVVPVAAPTAADSSSLDRLSVTDLPPQLIHALTVAVSRAGSDRVLACLHTIVALCPVPSASPAPSRSAR